MKIPTEKESVARDANVSPRRVARTPLACTECRTRKYKCGGKMPICSSCDMRGTECVYPDTEGRKRLSYKHALEEMAKKIATLEANAEEDKARILSLESKLEAVKTMKPPQAVVYGALFVHQFLSLSVFAQEDSERQCKDTLDIEVAVCGQCSGWNASISYGGGPKMVSSPCPSLVVATLGAAALWKTLANSESCFPEEGGQPPSGQCTVKTDGTHAFRVHGMQSDSVLDFSTILVTETEAASNLQSSSSHATSSTTPLNADFSVLASYEDPEVSLWLANFWAQNPDSLS